MDQKSNAVPICAELNAIVPTVGFNLSTWSLAYVKVLWIDVQEYFRRKRESKNEKDATGTTESDNTV